MADWNPGAFSLWTQRWGDAGGKRPATVLLRHATSPSLSSFDASDESALQKHAHAYLVRANQLADLKLPQAWLDALAPGASSETFGWLPIGWPDDQSASPLASYKVIRRKAGKQSDFTLILVATESTLILGKKLVLGSEFGVRVTADARWDRNKNLHDVRFCGVSAAMPFGHYRAPGASVGGLSTAEAEALLVPLLKKGTKFSKALASELRLKEETLFLRGFRFTATQVEARGVGMGAGNRASDRIPYAFLLRMGPGSGERAATRYPLVADATTPGHAWVFPRDPASQAGSNLPMRARRPSRSDHYLERFRVEETVTAGRKDPLVHGTPEDMRVVVSPRFVRADSGIAPDTAKSVDLPGTKSTPPIRSNDLSAVHAYRNVAQLFERLGLYGIDPDEYFRSAKLPLKVVYRSGVRPGPGKDGQTVNARVHPVGWNAHAMVPASPGDRPELEMHLALADLSRRSRARWNGTVRSPAEPLGIAADARWIWHEIGHVLTMASIGELEFRFAHSAGDALAAIVADPQSDLATDPIKREKRRGATFPWVFIPRRHDRCVLHGWSWCGSMHRSLAQLPDADRLRRKGYRSEQILSSSLFRLYRCLGGDTYQDGAKRAVAVREAASHYAVYLIMRGIQLLGETVPPNHVDEFVSALIHADTLATEELDFNTLVADVNENIVRVGGCAHKVIRWAFEAQGLYAADPNAINNAPGVADKVDVYIMDGRLVTEPTAYGDIAYGRGSYLPVSLDWDLAQDGSVKPPAWQAEKKATNDAIKVGANGKVTVTVENRGTQLARGVKVRVWWHAWKSGDQPPAWGDGQWIEYDRNVPPAQDIPPGGAATFGKFKPASTAPKRYLVLAQATCDDDRANTDVATAFPCSRLPTALVDLVANDNNLGLRVVGTP